MLILDASSPALTPVVLIEPEGEKPDSIPEEPQKTTELNRLSRWWLQIGIGDFCVRTLYDSGAAHVVMGSVGLQIASSVGKPLIPYLGPRESLANGQHAPIIFCNAKSCRSYWTGY